MEVLIANLGKEVSRPSSPKGESSPIFTPSEEAHGSIELMGNQLILPLLGSRASPTMAS